MKHSRKNLSAGRLLYQRFERIAQLSEGDSKGLGYSGASKSGSVFAAGLACHFYQEFLINIGYQEKIVIRKTRGENPHEALKASLHAGFLFENS